MRKPIEYIINEINGTLPINEWLIPAIKEHAKRKFGITLDIYIKTDEEMENMSGASPSLSL